MVRAEDAKGIRRELAGLLREDIWIVEIEFELDTQILDRLNCFRTSSAGAENTIRRKKQRPRRLVNNYKFSPC